MTLSIRPKPYIIPEYSLTGDLLAYLNCGLQYRYYNKGSLPPSVPVQLWFGEFIHGVMEEAYLQWKEIQAFQIFPWEWGTKIRDIEIRIHKRLSARGLYPPPNLFCPFDPSQATQGLCPDDQHPHQLLASRRTDISINTWGKHLFPLIDQAEIRLKGIRDMPHFQENISRSNYYGITGIVDVLTSVTLKNAPAGNLILQHLNNNDHFKQLISNLTEDTYEIIIDYKGMKRPSTNDPSWQHHDWQVKTYGWLREQEPDAKPVIAGIIFYLNELFPSKEDIKLIQDEVKNSGTDILPTDPDKNLILNWKRKESPPPISREYKEDRSIRVFPFTERSFSDSLEEFDKVVDKIEDSVLKEIKGNEITGSWDVNPVERTCTACDFKTFCPNPAPSIYKTNVP